LFPCIRSQTVGQVPWSCLQQVCYRFHVSFYPVVSKIELKDVHIAPSDLADVMFDISFELRRVNRTAASANILEHWKAGLHVAYQTVLSCRYSSKSQIFGY
jgi:hypothetical protein